jgi:hypothetical protein
MPWKRNKCYILWDRERDRICVFVCVYVASFTQHAIRMRRNVISPVACPAVLYLSTLSHKMLEFKEAFGTQNCVVVFFIPFVRKMSYYKKNSSRHRQTLPDTARHCQAPLDTARHRQTLPDTARHCQTLSDTARHRQTPPDTVKTRYFCEILIKLEFSLQIFLEY